MRVSRRTVLKGGGALGAGLFVTRFVPGWPGSGSSGPAEELAELAQLNEEFVPTTCWIGKQDCGMIARKINGRVVKFEGDPAHPRNRGTLCPKGAGQIQAIYDPNRVKTPLVRTNEKGVTGTWRQASWDEALTMVADKIKEIPEDDRSKYLIWQKGRSKAGGFYDNAFVKASGATKLHHGAFCSDAGYRAMELTTGLHGVLHPDFRHTRYLLSFGWNAMNGGGNKFCQITWHQQLIEARERGLKVVHLDPSRRTVGPFADEWLPIKPGTDMAFFLALANVLIENGYVDTKYLTKHSNAVSLVKADGTFLTETRTVIVEGDDGEEEEEVKIEKVWDAASGGAVAIDTEGVQPALEGSYTVDGVTVKTGFELFKEHVEKHTPEWAAEICDLSTEAIRKVAMEMGEAAMIGSTIEMDGITLPYRPVAIMAYHVSQQELGFQALRAAALVSMLLGTIEAVGGQRTDFTWKVHKNWEPFGEISVKEGPYNAYLKGSKFFPINSNNSSIVAHAMLDPEKWELEAMPKVMIIHMANPVIAFPDQKAIMDSYKLYEFIAVIDPWLSETADLFADVVLPAATIEKYEGPMGAGDQYVDAKAMRIPPMDPLFDSRGDIDIYLDLCEKADILYGEGGYIDIVNSELKLEDNPLSLTEKPQVRDIFDRWAKQQGLEGISHFEQRGVWLKGDVPASKYYGYAQDPPFDGIRHRFYGESLLRAQEAMKEMGADEIFWRLYTPLPTWMTATLEGSPPEYDLYLISRKMIEFKQARSTFIPVLNELAPKQFLEINPKTAKDRGIDDGDEVWVESQNAVTGETRKVKTSVSYLETIRPDTVCLPHHFGFFTNPITKDQGPTANALFFSGEGYVSNTADQSFHVKVKVYPA
ncbi:MAG: molybdopterin-dependent oxidoreductase [Dehalococcoidia bacterium]